MTLAAIWQRARNWLNGANFFPFSLWAFLRTLLLLWGAILVLMLPVRALSIAGDPPRVPPQGLDVLFEPWARWDTMWYLRIAASGYSPNDLTGGFFPLYPLLIRALSMLIPNLLVCAVIISSLAALGAMILFYDLAGDLTDKQTARRALLYWVLFPTSFYLFAGYAESLFVMVALFGLQSARKGRWAFAGMAAALAVLSRPPGFLFLVPIGIEWLLSGGPAAERIRRALWLGLAPLAFGAFSLYLYWQFGDPLFWLHTWKNEMVLPWDLVLRAAQFISTGTALANNIVDLSATILIVVLSLIGLRRLPLSLTAFAVVVIIVQLMAYRPSQGFQEMPMEGMARRLIVVFPAFLTLAQVWKGRFREPLLVGVSLSLQLVFTSIFVRWLWLD